VLSPEIYCAETADWRLITLSNPQLSFGLWPGIFQASPGNVMVLANMQNANAFKVRFDITSSESATELREGGAGGERSDSDLPEDDDLLELLLFRWDLLLLCNHGRVAVRHLQSVEDSEAGKGTGGAVIGPKLPVES
jgi:hypothetical protein